MALDSQDRQEIRLYLLGQLEPELRSQRVEERMLTESDYYEELIIIEDEVIEEYVAGRLTPDERVSFEQHFLSAPERVRKLRFARLFSDYVAAAPVAQTPPARARVRLPALLRPLFAAPFRAAATVAAVLVVCSLPVWMAYRDRPDPRVGEGLAALRRAYVNGPPVESRIADWQYAPRSVTRGGAQSEAEPISLAHAESLLTEAAYKRPSSASRHALGLRRLAEKKFDQAIALLEEAVRGNDDNAAFHNDLGVALLEQEKAGREGGAPEKELEALGRSVEHFDRAVGLDPSLTEAYFNRALAYQRMGLWRQAEEGWREYLNRDADSPWADEARSNLKLLEESGHAAPSNADDDLKSFLDAARSVDDAAAWKVVGRNYTSAGNGVANRLLDFQLELAFPGDLVERDAVLPALSYLARLERDRDGERYTSELVDHYERATPKQRALLGEARAHMKAGYELFNKTNWAEAVGEYEKAKLAYERAGANAERAFVEYRLAHCYVFLPDLKKARAGFEKLSADSKANEYRWLRARALFGLAHVSINSNEFSKAADYSGRALSEFEQAGDLNGVLGCLVQLADINRDLNRVEQSLGYLRRVLALTVNDPADPKQRWGFLVQVAFGLSSKRLNAAALFYQKEALGLARDMGGPLLISRSLSYVGSAYASREMYAEALDSARQALEVGQAMPDGSGRAEIVANASQRFGDILRQSGDCGRAVEAYDRGIRLYGELNDEYYSYMAHRGKLLCFMAARDDGAAGEELKTVLSLLGDYRAKINADGQRNSFFDKQQDIYDLAIRYGYERIRDPDRAFEYSEEGRARSLLDLLQGSGEVLNQSDGPDLSLAAVTRALTLEEIKDGLPDNVQVLQYAVLEDKLLIWVVTKSGVRVAEANVGARELSEKVRAYLALASAPPAAAADNALSARAAELYGLLVAPAQHLLDQSKFLCIVPDKVLHYLPYEALVSNATGNYLMEDYELGFAPSSSTYVAKSKAGGKAAAAEETLVSIGAPSFSRAAFPSLPPLPSAAKEAAAIKDSYGGKGRALVGGEASEQAVKSELQKADVAHFAMHYLVDENSEMLSGFPLAPERAPSAVQEGHDGFLQSYEIYKLSLRRTRLVVLSACQTGIEREYGGEGAVGVARPFLVAGAASVVASLWPVDTDASADLMINFHQQRRRGAVPATEALRRAQRQMARGPDARYRHPYYWAPFVVIGGHART